MNKYTSANSFYHLGDIDILTFEQDEKSKLYKIYLSTSEHYVVSREFDKTKGLYANAPEAIIRKGLMDFSASLLGKELSYYDIMDMFIDRCFDDSVFDRYTENAVWMCMDYPSYEEIEEILSTYCCRIKWFDKKDNDFDLMELLNTAIYKTPVTNGKSELAERLMNSFKSNRITSIFMNKDMMVEKFITEKAFENFPIFMAEFSSKNGDELVSFKYLKH